MQMGSNMIIWINAICSFTVSLMGYWGYKKSGDKDNLLIVLGISFGLFTIAYILDLDGHGVTFNDIIVLSRWVGFIFLIFGVPLSFGRK